MGVAPNQNFVFAPESPTVQRQRASQLQVLSFNVFGIFRALNTVSRINRPGHGRGVRRRVQRRNIHHGSHALERSFSPLNAGCDGAVRRPYHWPDQCSEIVKVAVAGPDHGVEIGGPPV
jgi:hypothetical protein